MIGMVNEEVDQSIDEKKTGGRHDHRISNRKVRDQLASGVGSGRSTDEFGGLASLEARSDVIFDPSLDEPGNDSDHLRLVKNGDVIVICNPKGIVDDKIIARDVHGIISQYTAEDKMAVSNALMGLTRMNPEYMDKRKLGMSDDDLLNGATDRVRDIISSSHNIAVKPVSVVTMEPGLEGEKATTANEWTAVVEDFMSQRAMDESGRDDQEIDSDVGEDV